MMHELYKYFLDFFREIEWISTYAKPLAAFISILAILGLARLSHYAAKYLIVHIVQRIAKRTKSEWDDIMLKKKVFNGVAHLVPVFILYYSCFFATPLHGKPLSEISPEMISQLSADYYMGLGPALLKLTRVYLIFAIVYILITLLNSCNEIYLTTPYSDHRPIKGYIQLLQILVSFLASILVISVLIGKDPTVLIAGMGAMAAVLMLVFKDTILGFVASIQLSANNMVKIGDWIEMPEHSADGTVVDITLNTIKIQNWDNTITTVPTYTLVSESFTNWKGMEESDGRRIKRSILIDLYSVRFCTSEMLKHFEKFDLIRDYVHKKGEEIKQFNRGKNLPEEDHINGQGLTNIGIFRIYLELYLKNNPRINQKMTLLVRQMQSTEKGVPIEIYAFSKIKDWGVYETIQAEIFDHIFAIIPEFGLKIFQSPTGDDTRYLFRRDQEKQVY